GGDGDDLIQVYIPKVAGGDDSVIATGGSGRDTYGFLSGIATFRLTVTDFATGAGGDLIDVSTLLNYSAANGLGYQGGNPLAPANGYLRLIQDGKNTLLQYDEDGAA
ncbi:type I secretion C-terminal target domain-containing protein, partial [Pseudomonas sp. 3A(2025)]